MSAFSPNCLSGKTILVTGASSGIGREVAIEIAKCGGQVILSGRDATRLEQTLAQLAGGQHVISVFALDHADATAEWVKEISQMHGGLHGIFHGAGTELVRPVRLTKSDQIEQLFASSVMAAFGLARAAGQKGVMLDGGSVVFMSSVAGSRGQAGMTAYSAAKAAIDGLVRSLACELAVRRVRANALVAGAVVTEMHERLIQTLGADGVADYESKHLLGFGTPADISAAVVFLMSNASRWVTGSSLVVDGGYMVR